MWNAMTRDVSPALADCELSFVSREPIDVARAQAQHAEYQRVLASLVCRLLPLPAEPAWPDSVFVEDVAIVLDEVAVMTRPGALSRRAEVDSVAAALRQKRRSREPGCACCTCTANRRGRSVASGCGQSGWMSLRRPAYRQPSLRPPLRLLRDLHRSGHPQRRPRPPPPLQYRPPDRPAPATE